MSKTISFDLEYMQEVQGRKTYYMIKYLKNPRWPPAAILKNTKNANYVVLAVKTNVKYVLRVSWDRWFQIWGQFFILREFDSKICCLWLFIIYLWYNCVALILCVYLSACDNPSECSNSHAVYWIRTKCGVAVNLAWRIKLAKGQANLFIGQGHIFNTPDYQYESWYKNW